MLTLMSTPTAPAQTTSMRTPVYRQFSQMGELCKVLTKWQQQLTVNNGKRAKRNKITKDTRGRGNVSATTYSSKYCGWVVHVIGKGLRKSIKNLPVSSAKGAQQPRSGVNGKWQTVNSEQRQTAIAQAAYCASRPILWQTAAQSWLLLLFPCCCCCCWQLSAVAAVGGRFRVDAVHKAFWHLLGYLYPSTYENVYKGYINFVEMCAADSRWCGRS